MKSLATHIALLRQLERERESRRTRRSSRAGGTVAIIGLLGVAGLIFGSYVLEELAAQRLFGAVTP